MKGLGLELRFTSPFLLDCKSLLLEYKSVAESPLNLSLIGIPSSKLGSGRILLLPLPPSAIGSQTGSIAAALYARVAAESPARGAAASLIRRTKMPTGELSNKS